MIIRFALRVAFGCCAVAYMTLADSLIAISVLQPSPAMCPGWFCATVVNSPWVFAPVGGLLNVMALCGLLGYWEWLDRKVDA